MLSLAGISVAITQAGSPAAAPLFGVRQQNDCDNPTSSGVSCILTAIKLQVPFELNGDVRVAEGGQVTLAPAAQVMVNVDGNAGRGFPLQLFPDNGHMLTTCDLTWDTSSSSACNRQVYHANGTVVDQRAPAKAGEALAVYFYGLGQTSPAAQTGAESPAGAAVTDVLGHSRVLITFRNGFVNAVNSTPRTQLTQQPEGVLVPVDSAGLFRGQFGIYQVNFTLPSVSPDYPCGGTARTNALLTISTSQGAEAVGVCFQ